MKLRACLFLICGSVFGQHTNEISANVGFSVRNATVSSRFGAGFAHKISQLNELTASYSFTPSDTHSVLGGYKRKLQNERDRIGLFLAVGVGATVFNLPHETLTKATGQFGGGITLDVTPTVSISWGAYGKKVDTIPLYFSTSFSIGKHF